MCIWWVREEGGDLLFLREQCFVGRRVIFMVGGVEKRERKKKKRLVVSSSRDTYIDELGVVALP